MQKMWIGMAAAGLVACVAGALPAVAIEGGIALVDMETLFSKYYKTQLADAQLKDQADDFNTERKDLVAKYEQMQEDFNDLRAEAQNSALSEEVRLEKRDLAEEKLISLKEQEAKIQRMETTRRRQLEEQQMRMRKKIIEEIREEITAYAQERNIPCILDSSGQTMNGVELVLFSDGKFDITDDILAILNKGQTTTPAADAETDAGADQEPPAGGADEPATEPAPE